MSQQAHAFHFDMVHPGSQLSGSDGTDCRCRDNGRKCGASSGVRRSGAPPVEQRMTQAKDVIVPTVERTSKELVPKPQEGVTALDSITNSLGGQFSGQRHNITDAKGGTLGSPTV